jgi:hypothetical protein
MSAPINREPNVRSFTSAVQEQLGYYVYRLIDPHDGCTFYVGKGAGNRLFSHINEADADLEVKTHKLDRIRAIASCSRRRTAWDDVPRVAATALRGRPRMKRPSTRR